MDSFLQITSTKPELEDTSFLSALDMDPTMTSNLQSPGGSRVNLASESLLAALSSPPLGMSERAGTPKVEATSKFSDFRRLVSLAVRRDTVQP